MLSASGSALEVPSPDIIEAVLAEKYLDHFVKQAWHVVEPKTPLIWGWHMDAICEHLEAVTRGEILRLLINIPPRHSKSLQVSVFWPAWTWIDSPHVRWLYSSYAETLSKRDSLKCRRLITSPWYQGRWSERFRLTSDQNEKLRYENNKGGYRLATSVGGVATGEGGDIIVVDDPHNVKQVESDVKRADTLLWWDESMSTRANNPKTTARVIIMQRSHHNDLAGHILEKEGGYIHLCLPARYEEGRKDLVTKTPLPFCDPRSREGEPLWPELYDEEALKRLEKDMTEYAVAGQLQQRPHPRGGGMFKVDRFCLIRSLPPIRNIDKVRYWDKAATEDGGKRTAGVLMGLSDQGRWVIMDVVKGQWSAHRREARIKQTAESDGRNVKIWVEQEPGSGGKESAESTIKNLSGWRVYADRVTGDKSTRAEPYEAQVSGGNVDVLIAPWTKEFLDEHESFPVGTYTDQVDAASGAFNKLNAKRKKAGAWGGS